MILTPRETRRPKPRRTRSFRIRGSQRWSTQTGTISQVTTVKTLATHVGVQAETWGHSDGQVGEETQEEGRNGGDCGGGSDKIHSHFIDAAQIRLVSHAKIW